MSESFGCQDTLKIANFFGPNIIDLDETIAILQFLSMNR